ncbi:MAG TPA: hypothetical protein VJ276_21540 [Thermoanaerobaculia bacterium]|nr:hypothetical protein [Thermoanaerobaculia bacterium]
MEPWFRRCASFEEEAAADREYWTRFTPDERVALIEDLKDDFASMTGERPRRGDFGDLLAAFTAHDVRALIIGAYAVAHHAKPRFTKDLDFFTEPSPENAERVLRALADFGFGEIGLGIADLSVPGKIIQLGFPPHRIDLVTSIDGVSFAEAWNGRSAGTLDGEPAFYIGRRELMRNKEASGRPQDLVDLALLRET